MNKLIDVIKEFSIGTDKYALGYIDEFYEDLFSNVKNSTKEILEIGVHKGESLRLWKEYFTNANVYGMDISVSKVIPERDRITLIEKDAYTSEAVSNFQENFFDIIIDDGPHTGETQKFFLKEYFKLLKPKGIMVLEDIIEPNILPELIELIDKNQTSFQLIDMTGKQKSKRAWNKKLFVLILKKT